MGDEDNEQEEEECSGWETYRNKEAGSVKHLGGRSCLSPAGRGAALLSHLAGGHGTVCLVALGVTRPLATEASVKVMLGTGKPHLPAAVTRGG